MVREEQFEVVVKQMTLEAEGVLTLLLEDSQHNELPPWTPGAHIELMIDGQLRQYSLCSSPEDRNHYRIGVLLEESSRGGSTYVHRQLRPGDTIKIRGLRNHFELLDAPSYLFIAGGIGITPLIPMIRQVNSLSKPWKMVYGGRTLQSMAFVEELREYGDKVALVPQDQFGLLDLDTLLSSVDRQGAVYCCGPEPLISAVETRCDNLDYLSLHVERFKSRPIDPTLVDEAIEVVCARSGITVFVPPDKSILECLEEHGVLVDSDCREGICATCETNVIEGIPEHRDSVLSPEEREKSNTMMICVSRSKSSRLVLDV